MVWTKLYALSECLKNFAEYEGSMAHRSEDNYDYMRGSVASQPLVLAFVLQDFSRGRQFTEPRARKGERESERTLFILRCRAAICKREMTRG